MPPCALRTSFCLSHFALPSFVRPTLACLPRVLLPRSFALSPRALLSKTKPRTPSGLADDPPSAPAGLEDDESEEENEVDYRANYQQLLSQVMSDLRDRNRQIHYIKGYRDEIKKAQKNIEECIKRAGEYDRVYQQYGAPFEEEDVKAS